MVIKQSGIKGTLMQPEAHSKVQGKRPQTFICASCGAGARGRGQRQVQHADIIQKKTAMRNKTYQFTKTNLLKRKYGILKVRMSYFQLLKYLIK